MSQHFSEYPGMVYQEGDHLKSIKKRQMFIGSPALHGSEAVAHRAAKKQDVVRVELTRGAYSL